MCSFFDRPVSDILPIVRSDRERIYIDIIKTADIDRDHLVPFGIVSPPEGCGSAGAAEEMLYLVLIETIFGKGIFTRQKSER